jgi:hypothetical protein
MTVGREEVRRKRDAWKANATSDLAKFLAHHMVPTIIGLGGRHYVIDHHHLALALHEEGIESVFVTVAADLSRLPEGHFWNMMSFKGWTHPYDGDGVRCPYDDLPKTVAGLEDDPYRSLAGALRNHGGFAKDSTPFAEFLWADFFRPRIKVKTIKADFDAAVAEALTIAKAGEADYLPGWCGPHGYSLSKGRSKTASEGSSKTGKKGRGSKTAKSK